MTRRRVKCCLFLGLQPRHLLRCQHFLPSQTLSLQRTVMVGDVQLRRAVGEPFVVACSCSLGVLVAPWGKRWQDWVVMFRLFQGKLALYGIQAPGALSFLMRFLLDW